MPAALAVLAGCSTAPTLAPDRTFDLALSPGNIVAFDDTTRYVAAGSADGRLRIWRLADGQAVQAWRGHTDSVHGLAFRADGRLLSASYDRSLALWSADGSLVQRRMSPSPITAFVYEAAQDLIITGHRDGMLRYWRAGTLQPVSEEKRHEGGVRALAYHAATGRIASSGHDGDVYVGRAGEPPQRLTAPPSDARTLIYTADGNGLVGAGWFKLFRWRLPGGELTILPTAHRGIIASVDLAADGSLMTISRQTDSAVYRLDPATGRLLERFAPHELCGAYVRVSPDGRYLASTSDDATVRIWNLQHAPPAPALRLAH